MALHIVDLEPRPAQKVMVTVGQRQISLALRQLAGRQFLSVESGDKKVCDNILVVTQDKLLDAKYRVDFDVFAVDVQGKEDTPAFSGWGDRFFLMIDDDPI